MMSRLLRLLSALSLLCAGVTFLSSPSASAASCADSVATSPDGDAVTASDSQLCSVGSVDPGYSGGGNSPHAGPLTQTLDCGAPVAADHLNASPNHFCSDVQAQCAVPSTTPKVPAGPPVTTLAFLVQNPDRTWRMTGFNCAASGAAVPPPTVTPFEAFAEVVKRVPQPPIGAAPGRGQTLVNMQTIFWVSTPADRSLGTVLLLGHRVGLRIHARSVAWDYGDGTAALVGGLGRPYTGAEPCSAVRCPGFDGHSYLATGSITVAATVRWSGQFRVDGGGWRDIADPATGANTVTGPAATARVRVLQARGVLVPDPQNN
jgi:hypothetical protein